MHDMEALSLVVVGGGGGNKPWFRDDSALLSPKPPLCSRAARLRCCLQTKGSIDPAYLPSEKKKMFIFGLGFVGLSLARHIQAEYPDWDVSGTCSSKEKSDALQRLGVHAFQFNYDNDGGELDTQVNPCNKRGVARREAEEAWLEFGAKAGCCVQVFRLGGIYGSGRSAIDTLLSSSKLSTKQRSRETRQHTSRIHVKDICRVLMASIESPVPGRILNVVDDEPASRAEVFSYARMLIHEKWPSKFEYVEIGNDKVISSYNSLERGEKRVANRRLKDELKIKLLYPSYKSGLKAIIDEMHI